AGLRSMVEDSPFFSPGLKIFAIREVTQCGVQEDQNTNVTIRACRAVLFTNAGEMPTHFHIRWIDKKQSQVFFEINACPLVWRYRWGSWLEEAANNQGHKHKTIIRVTPKKPAA